MKDIQQLIKKSNEVGRYDNVFPKTFIDAIKDRETGVSLREILSSFNMFFLPYVGSKTATRLLLPKSFRRQGVWLTYVTWNKTVVIEWYDNDAIDDTSFGDDVNWRQGSNMLVGDITINAEGNWVINGEDTGIPARGELGITPILRVSEDNRLEVSYNEGNTWNSFRDIPVFIRYRVHNNKLQESVDFERTWEDVSDYIGAWFRWNKISEIDGTLQISRDEKKTWEDISPIIATDVITNSEDIIKNSSKELEFANKEYNPEEFSGLGKIYLRKNIVDGKNILTQEMINKPNTIYIIQYDYILDNIKLPTNSSLYFQGGCFIKGKVTGQLTGIINNNYSNIFNDCEVFGTWNVEYSYPEWFGAKGDSITDDTIPIQKCIDYFKITKLLPKTYSITDTIRVGNKNKVLVGSNSYQLKKVSSSLIYNGEKDNKKSLIILGQKSVNVGDEPNKDASNILVTDLLLDCNNLVGFGIYGTYLTNESEINNIIVLSPLEHGLYVARSWYSKITNILVKDSYNCGITLGCYLELIDGTKYEWKTSSPIELNQIKIDNIRAYSCGKYFSIDNKNTFNPIENQKISNKGYGIGIGTGNGLTMTNFLSEGNGGTGLYCYLVSHPRINISYGYTENNCLNSGLDAESTKPAIIIDSQNNSTTVYNLTLSDIFVNYKDGGILKVGEGKNIIKLINIQQPRFLKDMIFEKPNIPLLLKISNFILDNCYWELASVNTHTSSFLGTVVSKTIDTRYSFEIDIEEYSGPHYYAIQVQKVKDETPIGSISVLYGEQNKEAHYPISSSITEDTWTFVGNSLLNLKKITKGGVGGDSYPSSKIKIRVVILKRNY